MPIPIVEPPFCLASSHMVSKMSCSSIFITWTLKGLAHAEGHLGNLERKCELLKHAFELQEKELGREHALTLVTAHFLEEVESQQRLLRLDSLYAMVAEARVCYLPSSPPQFWRLGAESSPNRAYRKILKIVLVPSTEEATGPPTQATGPPRSDAGVGIGMLMGDRDSLARK